MFQQIFVDNWKKQQTYKNVITQLYLLNIAQSIHPTQRLDR